MEPGTCGPRAHEASASDAPSSWCSHPAYARYWRHYREAAAWMRIHRRAYRKAVRCCFGSPWYFAPGIQHHSACPGEPWYPPLRDRRTAGEEQAPWPEKEEEVEEEEEGTETESDGEVECDLSHMEITEELRQYFATTERHRAERRRQQQLDAARLDDYVNADHDLYFCPRSAQPPAERPGERRQAEMKLLYGEAAAKIQAMEAAVQLSFDRRCDRKLPKYWPVIPLKF